MSAQPTVSVLMPVYNVERYVAEATESILSQTYEDFEFIVVDDGSTDASLDILQNYTRQDKRIRLTSRPNTGLVGALNDGLTAARGQFLARMDADDVSLPERLEKQVEYLEQHPKVVGVGCRVMFTDPEGLPLRCMVDWFAHDEIEAELLRGGQGIVGAAATMRREALVAVGGYRQECNTLEDLDMSLRIGEKEELANLRGVFYCYRQRFGSICRTQGAEQRRLIDGVLAEAHGRRGLRFCPDRVIRLAASISAAEERRKWAWWALGSGYVAAARKHAFAVLRQAPLSVESWRLAACAVRGH
jgi:glycosyltransferase involved in cell wall biosynthesis